MISFGIRSRVKNFLSKPNKNALFIFGFQKSGTSAIAGILAARTDKTVTIDTNYLWNPTINQIKLGKILVKDLVSSYSYPFSKDIIKEPSATFIISELSQYFYLNQYVFVVRNPFDNIRSILNRLNLPGDKNKIEAYNVHENWRYLFKTDDYIMDLANRWVLANDQTKFIKTDKCILVKYEDFMIDKQMTIDKLADDIKFEKSQKVSHLLEKQFQPKGQSDVDVKFFFGEKNYNKIFKITKHLLTEFDYSFSCE